MSNPFVANASRMLYTRTHPEVPSYAAAMVAVGKAGDRHLGDPLWSVMDKSQVPASGTKHDYMSIPAYYWPNPDTADGLPYVYRDGQINPEYTQITDRDELGKLVTAVGDLSAAWYFTGQTKYSDKAAAMVRTWFLDPATKMNPNMDHAGMIKGVNTGTFTAIVEACYLYKIVDAVRILQGSPSWTAANQTSFAAWGAQYLTWLLTSDAGKHEATNTQNHGTLIQGQIASFAELTGNHFAAVNAINRVKSLINKQINTDGYQPLEMVRTRPWNYACLNVTGLLTMARFGQLEGIDLWNYVAPNGGSIRKAINFLRPYANRSKVWPYPDLDMVSPWLLTIALRQSATGFHDSTYTTDANKSLNPGTWAEYTALLY